MQIRKADGLRQQFRDPAALDSPGQARFRQLADVKSLLCVPCIVVDILLPRCCLVRTVVAALCHIGARSVAVDCIDRLLLLCVNVFAAV